MNGKYIDSFMGANTSAGFVSRFDQICENEKLKKIYVIKGGAGTGKSTLMKKVAEEFFEDGQTVEKVHCSSDPDSLDAVIVEEKGFAILDGTPPHPVEPKYPGAKETLLNFYPCWNEKELEKELENIKDLVEKYTEYHKKACGLISVASALIKENMRIAKKYINYSKIDKYIKNLLKREFKDKSEGKGKENIRFYSAVTPKGVKVYTDTVERLCDKCYVIEDDIGVVSQHILKSVKNHALSKNLDIFTAYCVISPYEKLEHVIIPEIKTAFLTSNKFHKVEVSLSCKCVKASRFTDIDGLNERKQYMSFNKKAAKQFLNEAVNNMKYAKKYHDELEKCYIKQVDFKKLDVLKEELMEKLKGKDL